MPIYSHSQLSTYEECPLKYKLCYRDGIKRDAESVEGFLGNMVHETLKKCYDDIKLTKLNTLDELLSYYDNIWQQNWHDLIVITKQDITSEHYKAAGKKMIETYYRRYVPFDADSTIQTEMRLDFALGEDDKYKLIGYIDRLACSRDGAYHIHDYKTSAYLPSQEQANNDRQLGLYHIGVQKRWPDIKNIKLVWHYLAFDRELVSSRSDEAVAQLVTDTTRLIDEIESAQEFPPKETGYCEWCEYPDLCPMRKHFYTVEALPANEYLNEPGVVLVNELAELKEKSQAIGEEMDKVKEALIEYARRENVTLIKGSGHKARVKFDEKLKFPGKNEAERQGLDEAIIQAGKWHEVSELETTALTRIVKAGLWDKELIDQIMKYGWIEETSVVSLSKLRDEER
jgi:RecB family exonuclease